MPAKKRKKYYAVFQGHAPGIYIDWDSASAQVRGFKGAKYKSFSDERSAILWLRACVLNASEAVSPNLIALIKGLETKDVSTPKSSPETSENTIIIHTDGGASPNPGKGGYGIVLQKGKHRKELSAGFALTTNNRMEMLAVIEALRALKSASSVILYSDSRYVVDSISKGWVYGWLKRGWKKSDGQAPENVDLWKLLLPLLKKHNVDLQWVKGHGGNKENERCDFLANQARKHKNLLTDEGYVSHI